tara:strand:+ start:211 stop:684 length:474 start_codon:yes stop_codon:yes gene_type:complete
MFGLYENLPKGDQALREHLDALFAARESRENTDAFDHLYECLSILDQKASSLLTFNAMILVVFTIGFNPSLVSQTWANVFLFLGIVLVNISAILLLTIVWVTWSATQIYKNERTHALKLLRVRRDRTIRYRISWYFSITSLGAMACYVWNVSPFEFF